MMKLNFHGCNLAQWHEMINGKSINILLTNRRSPTIKFTIVQAVSSVKRYSNILLNYVFLVDGAVQMWKMGIDENARYVGFKQHTEVSYEEFRMTHQIQFRFVFFELTFTCVHGLNNSTLYQNCVLRNLLRHLFTLKRHKNI